MSPSVRASFKQTDGSDPRKRMISSVSKRSNSQPVTASQRISKVELAMDSVRPKISLVQANRPLISPISAGSVDIRAVPDRRTKTKTGDLPFLKMDVPAAKWPEKRIRESDASDSGESPQKTSSAKMPLQAVEMCFS